MPENPQQLEQEVERQDEMTRQARLGGIAGMIPRSNEPLSEATLNTLAQAIATAVPLLSGGQVPEVALPEVTGPQDRVPTEIGAQLVTIAGFIDKAQAEVPGLERYAFDPVEAMTTDAGLAEAAHIISGIASDEQVLAALSQPGPPPGQQDDPTEE